ncbi:hypothetical protein HanRHA438_Chr06g0274921 [Helianthus annuus]|nr:hypothetical protein HanHA89_Chr06g0233721 [Helianthus annuus]KAJ0738379.1 hypothetical protein HanLR1_Chr06g0217651 [Helianthus annuus]KAJ0741268.1 hypothetical protein HanOQP8_Chr06g0226171 [Helianthus annuus]KAJ0912488.1 hypothetical protein HanRHA438_Chr06g0274921 [Helianthus annuus]
MMSFRIYLTSKTNLNPRQRLFGNEIAKVGDYSCNFRKLGTICENRANHRDYTGTFLFEKLNTPCNKLCFESQSTSQRKTKLLIAICHFLLSF